MTCEYCGGSGKFIRVEKSVFTPRLRTVVEFCVCTKAQLVCDSPDTKMLLSGIDVIIPEKDISSQLEFDPLKISESPDLLIKSSDYMNIFLPQLKAFIIKHRFSETTPLIRCCHSINILHDFYVQQSDGSSPHLSETQKYDLLIFTIGTQEKNEQLKTCIAQVVYLRRNIKKPTWIYMTKDSLEMCIQEYSPDLAVFLKDFKSITLVGKGGKSKPKQTLSQKSAANFQPLK